MGLSEFFARTAAQLFGFLVSEFGFTGPIIRQIGWQSTTLHYLSGQVSVSVNLDMEESVLVTIELWDAAAKADYPTNERRRFAVESLARFRDPDWRSVAQNRPLSESDVERVLAADAAALRAHAVDVLEGRTDELHSFLAALDAW